MRTSETKLNDFRAMWQERTRNNVEYKIYDIDGGGIYPVHGAVRLHQNSEIWTLVSWTAKGTFRYDGIEDSLDLLPVEKRDRVMFRNGEGGVSTSARSFTETEWYQEWGGIGLTVLCFLSEFEEWLKNRKASDT